MPHVKFISGMETDLGAMRAWHCYLMKNGWNIDEDGNFICPDCIAKRTNPKLKLTGLGKDPEWVDEYVALYEKWIEAIKKDTLTI